MKTRHRFAPQGAHDFNRLIGHHPPTLKVGIQEFEFFRPPADSYAENEATLRKQVQGGHLLGHNDGVALRHYQGVRAKFDARHKVDQAGEGDERFNDLEIINNRAKNYISC